MEIWPFEATKALEIVTMAKAWRRLGDFFCLL